ncbi:MAG: hypothetical protein PHI11_01260 [Gallionella sp.]|nr:hypothetical protein [Gallionella sp.]
MTLNEDLPNTQPYSIATKIIFWILWMGGLMLCLLFIFFFILMLSGRTWQIALWNLLVVLTQGYVLIRSGQYFLRSEKSPSALLLWAVFACISMPIIAFSGCLMLSSFAPRMAG